jgi:GNAT superfamily N-acetyltransferase
VTIGEGEDEVVIGGASYAAENTIATSGRSVEVAFLVEEDFQGRGIASLLMQHILPSRGRRVWMRWSRTSLLAILRCWNYFGAAAFP